LFPIKYLFDQRLYLVTERGLLMDMGDENMVGGGGHRQFILSTLSPAAMEAEGLDGAKVIKARALRFLFAACGS
jgi:hypothetical protein